MPPAPPLGRVLRPADFQRLLAVPPRSRSTHFAAHHVAGSPVAPAFQRRQPLPPNLSTGDAPSCAPAVDECVEALQLSPPVAGPRGQWLGLMVPKKHARRAVTRTLIKRQMRAVAAQAGASLAPGLWLLRLKAPFDRRAFPSAASEALARCVRAELQQLLAQAAKAGPPAARRPRAAAAPAPGVQAP